MELEFSGSYLNVELQTYKQRRKTLELSCSNQSRNHHNELDMKSAINSHHGGGYNRAYQLPRDGSLWLPQETLRLPRVYSYEILEFLTENIMFFTLRFYFRPNVVLAPFSINKENNLNYFHFYIFTLNFKTSMFNVIT